MKFGGESVQLSMPNLPYTLFKTNLWTYGNLRRAGADQRARFARPMDKPDGQTVDSYAAHRLTTGIAHRQTRFYHMPTGPQPAINMKYSLKSRPRNA